MIIPRANGALALPWYVGLQADEDDRKGMKKDSGARHCNCCFPKQWMFRRNIAQQLAHAISRQTQKRWREGGRLREFWKPKPQSPTVPG